MLRTIFSILVVPILFSCEKSDYTENPYENKSPSEYIAVFGDIQGYTNHDYIHLFTSSLNWIEENQERLHIRCVLHTGDITLNNSLEQWSYFKKAMENFSLPFISNIGNHDYQWKNGSSIPDRNDTYFSEYTRFPLVTSRIEAAFETDRMENIVVRNEIHGERYDLLLLEFGPRKEVVEWANEWVAAHPDIKYILMNHEYLEKGGGRRTTNLKCEVQFKNKDYVTPEELWNQLIRCNDNIVCILCGHVGGLYAVTYEKNDFGREVCQIQHNIQESAYRYENWIMMWEFPKESDSAVVSIFNARSGKLYNSTDALFTFRYRY